MPASAPLSFTGQRLLIVGLAREGTVVARWLTERGADVVISDVRSKNVLAEQLAILASYNLDIRCGPQTPDLLTGIDAAIVSPGVPQDIPLLAAARAEGIPLTSEPRLFAQQRPAPIVGITGSSGKTTTATLTARMLEASNLRTWLGGNIGTPLLGKVRDIATTDRVVMELSSFQLLYWTGDQSEHSSQYLWDDTRGISPHIAAVLNLTPNHLDRHPSMSHYAAAKANILAYQTEADIAVLNGDDPVTAAWASAKSVNIAPGEGQQAVEFPLNARVLTFSLNQKPSGHGAWLEDGQIWFRWQGNVQPIMPASDIQLRGKHNLSNVLAACSSAAAAGAQPTAIAAATRAFTGVPHRLEIVSTENDVMWINDSIATSPERSLAALRSFDEPLILLAGGRDKHLPWQEWADFVHQHVRVVIIFGEASDIIQQALASQPTTRKLKNIYTVNDLTEAVDLARGLACCGDDVLLSPGGTSYDAYEDFAARGDHFRQLVNDSRLKVQD